VHAFVEGEAFEALAFIHLETAGRVFDVGGGSPESQLRMPLAILVWMRRMALFLSARSLRQPLTMSTSGPSSFIKRTISPGSFCMSASTVPRLGPGVAEAAVHRGGLAGVFYPGR